MEWTDEEIRCGSEANRQRGTRAVMTRAVELAAARGGMMPDVVRCFRDGFRNLRFSDSELGSVAEHITSQGARILMLEEQKRLDAEHTALLLRELDAEPSETLRGVAIRIMRERDALSRGLAETNQRAQDNWEKQEAERERLQAELSATQTERDRWRSLWENETRRVVVLEKAGQELSAAVDKHVGEPQRYPCSPTCTHDDARTPSHPERVKKSSADFVRATCPNGDCAISRCETCPERVKERSEAFAAVVPCPPSCPSHNNSGHTHRAEAYEAALPEMERTEAYDSGAEAMRAACWEEAQKAMEEMGVNCDAPFWNRMKTAIEGAAP